MNCKYHSSRNCDCITHLIYDRREATQNRLTQVEDTLKASEDERVDLANELAQSQNACASLDETRTRFVLAL